MSGMVCTEVIGVAPLHRFVPLAAARLGVPPLHGRRRGSCFDPMGCGVTEPGAAASTAPADEPPRSVTEPAPAQAQQQYRQVLAFGAKFAVALDDLHFAAMDQPRTARGHASPADRLGDLAAALHRGQNL